MLSFLALSIALTPAFAGGQASSFRPETRRGANFWNANAAIDGKKKTAWMVKGDSKNVNEWIMIDAPNGASSLDKVAILPGFAKSDETFKDYARVKSFRIEALKYNNKMELKPTGNSAKITLKDKKEMQTIDIPKNLKIDSESGGKYKFIVTAVYPGKDYPNFAVSEIRLYLEDFKVAPKVVAAENAGSKDDVSQLIDGKKKTFWTGKANMKLGIEAGNASISRLGIMPSSSKKFARPKKIKITTSGRTTTKTLADKNKVQWVWIPSVTGYPGGSSYDTIYVEVLETYKGKNRRKSGSQRSKHRQ